MQFYLRWEWLSMNWQSVTFWLMMSLGSLLGLRFRKMGFSSFSLVCLMHCDLRCFSRRQGMFSSILFNLTMLFPNNRIQILALISLCSSIKMHYVLLILDYFQVQQIISSYIEPLEPMQRRSQIRKLTLQQLLQLCQHETNPQLLKLYTQQLLQKKQKLSQKQCCLKDRLADIRQDSYKAVGQMAEGARDRLEKTERVVMDSTSRPTKEDVKELSDLFAYMQHQNGLITRNSHEASMLHARVREDLAKVAVQSSHDSRMDASYEQLQVQCKKQEAKKEQLQRQLEQNRGFYAHINSTIEQYRIKYEQLETKIAIKEKQLDHLVSYFKLRQSEDQQKIDYENSITNQLQHELLQAQTNLNATNSRAIELKVRESEYLDRVQQSQ